MVLATSSDRLAGVPAGVSQAQMVQVVAPDASPPVFTCIVNEPSPAGVARASGGVVLPCVSSQASTFAKPRAQPVI